MLAKKQLKLLLGLAIVMVTTGYNNNGKPGALVSA